MSEADIIPNAEAAHAADALSDLTGEEPAFLPHILHWEIVLGDKGIEINGQLPDETRDALGLLETVAKTAPNGNLDDSESDRILRANFTWIDVPVSLWWMPPIRRWTVPAHCATCPTELGAPGVPFVRIGEGRDAPVICIPCRDLMHKQWIAASQVLADAVANQIAEGN